MRIIKEPNTVQVVRQLAAPAERVFSAFADPALVSRWLSPAAEIVLEVLAYDFRVGGSYRFAYHVPGQQIMRVNGEFTQITPPASLAFTWIIEAPDVHAGLNSLVTATITPNAAGCELRIDHARLDLPGSCDRHHQGWIGALEQMAQLVQQESEHHGQ